MFGGIKKLWAQSAITSAIEGVIREASNGNNVGVQTWYFKIKKEAYIQSSQGMVSAEEIEERALRSLNPKQSAAYLEIVERLSQVGQPLEEVNNWLKNNKPI